MGAETVRESGPRRVLMLAYVFPPFFSIGGSIRAVKFIKYLPSLGWLPTILTIDDTKEHESQLRQGSEELLADIPQDVRIRRTASGEPSVELLERGRKARERSKLAAMLVNSLRGIRSAMGRYLLIPDEQITWLPFALRLGLRIVSEERVDVLFATCPPHAVAVIASTLKKVSGKPLVLDFRDDWIDTPRYRQKPLFVQWVERRLERWAVTTADRVITVSEWSQREFLHRYGDQRKEKFVFIPNGCDLSDFVLNKGGLGNAVHPCFTIVHAGLLTDAEDWTRSPASLFRALARILDTCPEIAAKIDVVFTGHLPKSYRDMADSMGLTATVRESGHLAQDAFLKLMRGADLLLTINYDGFATLIPGKIYEYWAVGSAPILLLSCPGAAQELVERRGLGMAVAPSDVEGIMGCILSAYRRREAGDPMKIATSGIERYDRRRLAEELARTLDNVVQPAQ